MNLYLHRSDFYSTRAFVETLEALRPMNAPEWGDKGQKTIARRLQDDAADYLSMISLLHRKLDEYLRTPLERTS